MTERGGNFFMAKEEKLQSVNGNDKLQLVDETLRDGSQSLWGMMMSYHMIEPVIGEIAQAGFDSINLPVTGTNALIHTRFFKEDPRLVFKMVTEKLKGTKSNIGVTSLCMLMNITGTPENITMVRLGYRVTKQWTPAINQIRSICCTQDEIKKQFPVYIPLMRSLGIEPIPYFAIGHSPRHTDEFYYNAVKEVAEKYKPVSVCIKDVDGLLVSERLRTLIPTFQKAAPGIPVELHSHGMNGQNTYNAVVAMQLGVRKITTCIPPLAYGSSHPSVFDTVRNAQELGIGHNMDIEKLKIVEERLTKIGKAFGHPVDNRPLPFDLTYYKHQIPGGVISNTVTQLHQLGIPDKLQEVLEEIPYILEDLGYPIMITPFSQYIVTQAVLNVQLGRWEQCLDNMVKFACGMNGMEDAGVPYMNQNLRDKLLSLPQAKKIKEEAEHMYEYMNSEPSEEECKRKYGMPNATDEEFILALCLQSDYELQQVTPGGPDTYRKFL